MQAVRHRAQPAAKGQSKGQRRVYNSAYLNTCDVNLVLWHVRFPRHDILVVAKFKSGRNGDLATKGKVGVGVQAFDPQGMA